MQGKIQFKSSSHIKIIKFTYETGGVIVTHGLGVTESLKHRVSLHNLIFQGALVLLGLVLLGGSADSGEVRNDLLGVLSLSGTRLTGDQHRLIHVIGQHVDVGTVRDGENMGWHLITALATVHLSATVGIHGVALVRIDGNAEKTRVGLFFARRKVEKNLVINTAEDLCFFGLLAIFFWSRKVSFWGRQYESFSTSHLYSFIGFCNCFFLLGELSAPS